MRLTVDIFGHEVTPVGGRRMGTRFGESSVPYQSRQHVRSPHVVDGGTVNPYRLTGCPMSRVLASCLDEHTMIGRKGSVCSSWKHSAYAINSS